MCFASPVLEGRQVCEERVGKCSLTRLQGMIRVYAFVVREREKKRDKARSLGVALPDCV